MAIIHLLVMVTISIISSVLVPLYNDQVEPLYNARLGNSFYSQNLSTEWPVPLPTLQVRAIVLSLYFR